MTDDDLKRLLEANAAETRGHFNETAGRLAAENRHYFDVAMESNKHEIGLIAEKVAQLDEKLDRKTAGLEERIERTAAETQAMIKFSHLELDRRMRTLEESLSDLQARVERLEGSAH